MPDGPMLYVEGKDDQHTILHLLKRHGLELTKPRTDPLKPLIHDFTDDPDGAPGVEKLIASIPTAIKTAEAAVGFVIDADPLVGLAARWDSVRDHLKRGAVDSPAKPEPGGFIGASDSMKIPVGVWLMPDNKREGTLETFLKELIDENDLLIQHAIDSTAEAASRDQRFPDAHLPKAELYTWLAWQKNPGRPYGTAVTAEYFRVDSPAALAFVDWIRSLYGL